MRVALISDVHGNLVSLDTVLAAISREGVDQIICLGDVPSFGPQPSEVLARLEAVGCRGVLGNHDRELIDGDRPEANSDAMCWVLEMIEWCAGQLTEENRAYLRTFESLIEVPLGDRGANMLCFHGSPRSEDEFILATTPEPELDQMCSAIAGHQASVLAAGHTHLQLLRRYHAALLVNPGSVGWPLERLPFEGLPCYMPWSEYAVVEWRDEDVNVSLHRVPIDLDAVRQAALDSELPRAALWAGQWVT